MEECPTTLQARFPIPASLGAGASKSPVRTARKKRCFWRYHFFLIFIYLFIFGGRRTLFLTEVDREAPPPKFRVLPHPIVALDAMPKRLVAIQKFEPLLTPSRPRNSSARGLVRSGRHGLHPKGPLTTLSLASRGSKNRYQNGTLISGSMGQNLRNPSRSIYAQLLRFVESTRKSQVAGHARIAPLSGHKAQAPNWSSIPPPLFLPGRQSTGLQGTEGVQSMRRRASGFERSTTNKIRAPRVDLETDGNALASFSLP